MIRVLTTHDQAALDFWWNRQMLGPNANHFMYATYTQPPTIESRTWDLIALAHYPSAPMGLSSMADAYLFLHLFRNNPCLSASVILMSENPHGVRSLIKAGERVARAHGVIYIDATVAETNERSVRLTTKILGKPWGLEPESLNHCGRMVGCYRFRRKL